MTLLVRRVWRIGVLTLEEINGKYFVSCTNRTYHKTFEIRPEKIDRWRQLILTGR